MRILILWNQREPGAHDARAEDAGVPIMAAVLDAHGFRVAIVDAEDDATRLGDAVAVLRPAVVLNLIDAFRGDPAGRVAVAGYLELLGARCVGSDPACLAACRDRAATRVLLDHAGVPVPRFAVIRDAAAALGATAGLRYPLRITHAHGDPERAARLVTGPDELLARFHDKDDERGLPCLVEEHGARRLVHAIVLGNAELDVLPLVERTAGELSLAGLDAACAERAGQLARRAFRVMGCRDVARIDLAIDSDGGPDGVPDGAARVVDVRPMFDMGPGSALWAATGSSVQGYGAALAALVHTARARAANSD